MKEEKKVIKITLQIFYVTYLISSIAGLVITNSFHTNVFFMQVLTAVFSVAFLISLMIIEEYSIIHHVSLLFYLLIVLTGMWLGLGSANTLLIVFSVSLVQVIILTFKGKERLAFLTFFIVYNFILIIYDMIYRFDDPNIDVYTLGGILGVSILVSGLFFILLTNRIYTEQLVDKLKVNSYFDMLTGIKNSRAFYSEMERIESDYKRYEINYVIVFLDINHYKEINDIHGHQTGDKVLQAFTSFIQTQIRKGDEIYRIGGDEFVIVLRKIKEAFAIHKMENIAFNLSQCNLEGHEITFSYGIASRQDYLDNFDKDDLNNMIKKADKKMFEYKQEKARN